jgi:hypothetical protein
MSDEQPKQPVTISRDNLHAQVWEKPMSRLANEYGISGNGVCTENLNPDIVVMKPAKDRV